MLAQNKPIAVLISDIHYNINTIELADKAVRQAIKLASKFDTPLIIAGDLHDTKANIRGECIKAIIDTLKLSAMTVYVSVGNHDLINEKGKSHSLEFLKPHVILIDKPFYVKNQDLWILPYYSDKQELVSAINSIPKGATLVLHQGVLGADMGHYIQDKTSLSKEVFADYRIISGHYHKRQDIKCGRPRKGAIGLFSYIGNPYTLSFGEANDPEKGFQILNSDGSLTFVPTNLRRHVIIELDLREYNVVPKTYPDDIIWLKLKSSKTDLDKINKQEIGERWFGHSNFKLELIPTDVDNKKEVTYSTDQGALDSLIDTLPSTVEHKLYLKELWKTLVK